MRWLEPGQALWALAAVVVFAGCFVRSLYKWRQRSRWPLRGGTQRRGRWVREGAILLLSCGATGCLVLALMRPQWPAQLVTPTFEKQDLVLILDRSVSMRARDVAPSRFARAVDEVRRFLDRKPPTLDRVALIGFAGTAVVLSYPTADLGSLFFYLDWVREDPSTLYGTDMGLALETALAAVEDTRDSRPPIFVLISDGEDQGTSLQRSAAAVRAAGIRVYTVGIGSGERVTIPVINDAGREELLRDEDDTIVLTRFSEGTLRELAAMTGGQYFRSTGGPELFQALDQILDGERRATGSAATLEYREQYRLLLACAAVAFLSLLSLW